MPPITYELVAPIPCPQCQQPLLGATHKNGDPAVVCLDCSKAWTIDSDPILQQVEKETHAKTPQHHHHRPRRKPRKR
jgi:uncharacterized protein YbaR (Trm112 family)